MSEKMHIKDLSVCICGGGSLGHVCAAFMGSRGVRVSILTNHPEAWKEEVVATDLEGKEYKVRLHAVSNDAGSVVPAADIILFCLPGFLMKEELAKIRPWIHQDQWIGSVVSSTGFFFSAISEFGTDAKLFGFQRVPFIARVERYGQSAHLLGYKNSLNVALWNVVEKELAHQLFTSLFSTPVRLLDNVLEVSYTNSNPILHPSRLYALFKDWKPTVKYDKPILFYEEWNDESSEILISCDEEFKQMLHLLPMNEASIPSLLEYYEQKDTSSLTEKIRSIEAFKGILTPMRQTDDKWFIPDFSSRYFTEDIPYGLLIIKATAQLIHFPTPHIDEVITWAQRMMGKTYLSQYQLADSDDISSISCIHPDTIRLLLNHYHSLRND